MDTGWSGVPLQKDYKIFSSKAYSLYKEGYETLLKIIAEYKIDIVLLCCSAFELLKYCSFFKQMNLLEKKNRNFKIISYLALESEDYHSEFTSSLEKLDLVILNKKETPTFIKRHIPCDKINLLEYFHSPDLSKKCYSKQEIRRKYSIPMDSYVIFGHGNNNYWDRLDLLIKAFCKFSINKPETILYLHLLGEDKKKGIDLFSVFKEEMRRVGLSVTNRFIISNKQFFMRNNSLLAESLSVCDLGIETNQGNGFCNYAAYKHRLGLKQILPKHSRYKEIFKGKDFLVNTHLTLYSPGVIENDRNMRPLSTVFSRKGYIVNTEEMVQKMNLLYEKKSEKKSLSLEGGNPNFSQKLLSLLQEA